MSDQPQSVPAEDIFLQIAAGAIARPNELSHALQNLAGTTVANLERILNSIGTGGAILPIMKGNLVQAYAVPTSLLPPALKDRLKPVSMTFLHDFKKTFVALRNGNYTGEGSIQWGDIPCIIFSRHTFEMIFHGGEKIYSFVLGPAVRHDVAVSMSATHVSNVFYARSTHALPGHAVTIMTAIPFFRDSRVIGYGVQEGLIGAIAAAEGLPVPEYKVAQFRPADVTGRGEAFVVFGRDHRSGFVSADLFEKYGRDTGFTLGKLRAQLTEEADRAEETRRAVEKVAGVLSAAVLHLKTKHILGAFRVRDTDVVILHGLRPLAEAAKVGFTAKDAGRTFPFSPAKGVPGRDLKQVLADAWDGSALHTFALDDGSVFGVLRGEAAISRMENVGPRLQELAPG